MEEKTEELRDIFIDVTDEDTVTERQEEGRGSLADEQSEADVEAGIRSVLAEMHERYEFDTALDDDALVGVVRGYFEGDSDTEIAEAIDVDRRTVFRARLDLQLLRDRDTDAPFELSDLRGLLAEDVPVAEIAEELDASESTVRRYRRVVRARHEARKVSDRFRAEFEDQFTDAELSEQMTSDVKEDGLEEATAGMESESDVSF
jgi:DNA-directed RNA polymerase specialized sigma24 family protein